MSLGLSTTEVTQLQSAVKTLVSPFDFESVGSWRAEARRAIAALIHADTSISILPLEGEALFQADRELNFALYAEHFHTMDKTPRHFRATGTHACTWQHVGPVFERPDRAAWLKSEFFNDWARPQRVCQPCGLMVVRSPAELPCPLSESYSGMAGLSFSWDRDEQPAAGSRELAILQLLLPAFEAGVHLMVCGVRERERVARVLDTLGEGAALIDVGGHVVYENPALRQLLARDPSARQLEAECVRAGRLIHALAARWGAKTQAQEILAPGGQQVRTAAGTFRVHGTPLGSGALGSGAMALVVLERTAPERLSSTDLHDRYRLTVREVAVSRLLAQGHSNAQVAQLLGISIHTARRHAEHVLLKLGVHSRAAVAGKLVMQ